MQSGNRGTSNASNRLQGNAARNRSRGQMNSANQLQSNADRLGTQTTGGLTAQEAASGVLPSERGRMRSSAGASGAVDSDNPYRTPPWQDPTVTGIPSDPQSANSAYPPEASRARASGGTGATAGSTDSDDPYRTPPWQDPEVTGIPSNSPNSSANNRPGATRRRSGAQSNANTPGAVDTDNPYRTPPWQDPTVTGIPSDPQQPQNRQGGYIFDDTSGVTDRFQAFRTDIPSQGTSQRGQGTSRDANGNGVLDSIEPYQSDPADSISPTQDNGSVSPGDWNRNTDTIDPVSENTTDALDDSDLDATNDDIEFDDFGTASTRSGYDTSDLNRGSGVQRDSNADGVLDSIEPYQSDPADTISPTQDNGQVSPGDWNRNTDTIDPVSENTADALDDADESNSTDATLDGSGTTNPDATTGSSTSARSSTRTSSSTGVRGTGSSVSRGSSTRASAASGLNTGTNVDADSQTPALRRAARLLGTPSGQNVPGASGLDRARVRASANAEQGLDRATGRTETNGARFRERFNLDE